MKRPYSIGWYRNPMVDGCVFLVSRVNDTTWFMTPYRSAGDRNPCGCGQVLTLAEWKWLEYIQAA